MNAKRTIVFVAAGLLLTACGAASAQAAEPTAIPTVISEEVIIAEGRLEPLRYAEVAFNAGGMVSEVLVAEGERVSAGQLIARLENDNAQTLESARAAALDALGKANEAVRRAQYELDNFDVPSDFAGLTPAEAAELMRERLDAARVAYEPYKYLGPNNPTAKEYKKRLDDAWAKYRKAIRWMELEANLETAEANLAQAQQNYASLAEGADAEAVAARRAVLAAAELRAPFSGTAADLDLKVGDFVTPGQPVVTVADFSHWVVKTTDLTEIDVVDILEGQSVTITLDAIPGVELNGSVEAISQTFAEKQGDIVYEITVALNDGHPAMRWGMTAEVKFQK